MSGDQRFSVFLVSCVGQSVSWGSLAAGTTYVAETIVSGAPVTGHDTWFTATSHGARCVVEWKTSTLESPFADGSRRVELAHGEQFTARNKTYVVYVEHADAAWSDAASPQDPDENVVRALRSLPHDELVIAARRFLALPFASAWWAAAFDSRTGFVQYRDGKVPAVNDVKVELRDAAVHLHWDVAVWDLFARSWAPDREQASFTRSVGPDLLPILLDCATVLAAIPVDG